MADPTQLSATVRDAVGTTLAGATVSWTTSDEAVATVSSEGLVTAVSSGSGTITATSGSASASASVDVADFLLAANGVTVICSRADVGDTGDVGGLTYTTRSKAQIEALVDEGDYEPLATTCTSDITDMRYMFYNVGSFNQDIGSWDVSSVTDMHWMFLDADTINQDIGTWDVSSVTNMRIILSEANEITQ